MFQVRFRVQSSGMPAHAEQASGAWPDGWECVEISQKVQRTQAGMAAVWQGWG